MIQPLLTLLLTGVCLAQTPVPVEVAIAGLQDAYQSEPVADRVRITLEDSRGIDSVEEVTVRVDASLPSPILALDLGRLRISAAEGTLTAVYVGESTTYVSKPLADPLTYASFAQAMHAVPAPQLRIALDGELELPHATNITWSEAVLNEHSRPPTITMSGRGTQGEAAAIIDASTGRLRRFESPVAQGLMHITIECQAVEPGDPSSWIIDPGGRRRVQQLGELNRPPRDLGPGDAAPNVRAISLPSSSWTLHGAVGTEPPRPVAMLAFRILPSGARADQIRRDVIAARDRVILALDDLAIEHFRLYGVGIVDQLDLELIAARREEWIADLDHPLVDRALPWTQDEGRAISAFDLRADAVLVIVDADWRIAAVMTLDGLADMPDALADGVHKAVETVKPEPPATQTPDSQTQDDESEKPEPQAQPGDGTETTDDGTETTGDGPPPDDPP